MDRLRIIWELRFHICVIAIMCFISAFMVHSIWKNRRAKYLPFLSLVWFVPWVLEAADYNGNILFLTIVDTFFCDAVDFIIFCLGFIPLVIFQVAMGIFGLSISRRKRPSYEKSNWLECLLLSPFPCCLLCSYIAFECYEFLKLPIIFFMLLLIVDKVILLKYKRFYLQMFVKCLATVIVSLFISFSPPSEFLIVLTDSMFDYALLQYWEHRPQGRGFSYWKGKMKGSK